MKGMEVEIILNCLLFFFLNRTLLHSVRNNTQKIFRSGEVFHAVFHARDEFVVRSINSRGSCSEPSSATLDDENYRSGPIKLIIYNLN